MLESLFTWLSIVAGVTAAWLWLQSTRVRYVKMRADIQDHERNIWLTTETPDLLEQPFRTSRLQNSLNARAALFTAATASLQAASLIAHKFTL